MAETQEPLSSRDWLRNRYRGYHPEDDYDAEGNQDLLLQRIMEDLQKKDESSAKFNSLLGSDPRAGAMFGAWASGQDPFTYILENYGEDALEAFQTEEGRAKLAESNSKYLKKVATDREAEEQRSNNFGESLNRLDAFKESHNLTDDQAVDIMLKIQELGNMVIEGNYTDEAFEMAYKALNYDTAVEEAERNGEVLGRNAKIKSELRKSTANPAPAMGGQGSAYEAPKPKPKRRDMFGLNM